MNVTAKEIEDIMREELTSYASSCECCGTISYIENQDVAAQKILELFQNRINGGNENETKT